MKASSVEMSCRERESYGQIHRLLLLNVMTPFLMFH